MADQTTIRFLYPPNFSGTFTDKEKGPRRYIVQCTNISDGTGEADAIKLKRTDLRNSDGDIPQKLIIEKIEYEISAASNSTGVAGPRVDIEYNNTNSDLVAVLHNGEGVLDFTSFGGFMPTHETDDGLTGVGDIVFTTANCYSGDTYNITLTVKASGE